MTSRFARFACALAVFGLAGCEAAKSSNPTAPSVAGPIPGVNITAPALLEPAQGFKFKENEQPIRLVVQNSTSSGVRPLTYSFEVAADSGFANKVFSRSGVAPGDGKTSVQIDRLDIGRAYYWRAWAEDGANTGAIATAGFEVFPKAAVNPPAAVAPANDETVNSATPTLKVQNAAIVGPVGWLAYEFQVATDEAFTRLVAAGIVNQGSGETTFNSTPLAEGTLHFWRVRASDGESSSGWSSTRVFRTPAAPKQPTPPSSPAPTGGGGGPCVSGNPETIVKCERAKYGHMNSSQTVSFLQSTARSLNANGISGAPFGILRKAGGTSCNGYSCDIVCSGNGSGQRQWDVLGDAEGAQTPAWGGPHSLPNIRVDVCEIQ